MVKPLSFKGDKKRKKRKREVTDPTDSKDTAEPASKSQALTTTTNEETLEQDDSWVNADNENDINGPVMIVLSTEPVTCLACDALGSVFALEVENIVEDRPNTAEPHDVRQVWIAGRVAGMEGYSFKGHHGKHLSCDKIGLLTANATAVSPTSTFSLLPSPLPSTFSLHTTHDTLLTYTPFHPVTIRGDAPHISPSTTLSLRMQARFKPRHKAQKEEKAAVRVSRKELEQQAGRKLEEDEVKKLKRAKREGNFYEVLVDVRRKGKHDKFA